MPLWRVWDNGGNLSALKRQIVDFQILISKLHKKISIAINIGSEQRQLSLEIRDLWFAWKS